MVSTSSTSQIGQLVTPDLLEGIREFWFHHLEEEDDYIIPSQNQMKRWFHKNEELDIACVSRYKDTLDKIRLLEATSSDVLAAVKPVRPLDWLSLILLFDQIPRNVYRGSSSSVVFRFFDQIAVDLARLQMESGVLSWCSQVRYRLAYRTWFLMPFEHSEKMELQDVALQQFEQMLADVEDLLSEQHDVESSDIVVRKCREVVRRQPEAARAFCTHSLDIEKKHHDIIQRFGKFPHRNQHLGRSASEEEEEYLRNGGETFGS